MRGQIHIYTGNGKGKTTAALGLSIRAVGADKRVFIGQFVKGMPYAELNVLEQFFKNKIDVKQYGLDCFIYNKPSQADIDAAKEGLKEISQIIQSNAYDMIVLDELTIALYYKLFEMEDVVEILKNKSPATEIVITGRYAPKELIDMADLVSDIQEVKHYYNKGVEAREGIEF